MAIQRAIVAEIAAGQALVNANRDLFRRMEAKVKAAIDRMLAKFWLKPVSIAPSTGFSPQDLSKLLSLVEAHQPTFVEAWDEFFSA